MNKVESTIQKMKLNPDYEKYFFQNASKYQNLYVWLEPLYKESYFEAQEDMRIYLSFLETVSLQNKEEERSDTTKILLDIVNAFFEFRQEHKSYDYYTDYSMVKILFNLPKENITLEHIDMIHMLLKDSGGSSLLNSEIEKVVLPVLVDNGMNEYILSLLRVIFDYQVQDKGKSYQEREPLLEKYWLNSLLEKHSKSIVEMIDIAGLEILISTVKQVIDEDEAAFNNVWIASIEEHPQNSFPERYDNQLISFTRDLLEYLDADKVKSFIENFLDEEHPIFKRLAFHTINNKYDELKKLFWNWFDAYKDTINTTFKHELYKLLQDNNGKFSEDEFDKLIAWIESLDYSKYYDDVSAEQLRIVTAYKKKEWLWSIKTSSTKAQELYEKYNAVNSSKLEHPGFDMWTSGTEWVGYQSPIEEKDVFCNKTVDEIIQEIKTFDPSKIEKERFTRDSDLIEGLANDLADCVKENPNKYSLEIEKFIELDWIYKYHLIYGLTNAWKEKKKFEWGKVFDFILNILDEDFFASQEQYILWMKGQIASLVEYGTKNDENAFDKKYLPEAKKILFLLLKHKEEEQIEYDNDMHTYVLNSINGKALHALINYTLRYGRLNSSHSVKWEDDVKDFFTKQLDENTEYSKSIFTILGDYLPNLSFLDKEWVDSNFNRIFPTGNDDLWEIAISGYFLYSSTVYTDIYEQFKQHGHIEKALNFKFKSDRTKRKVIQHICIMYNSSKDDETILDVIESKDQESILELIRFMWQIDRKNITEEARTKIFSLWQKIYDVFREDNSSGAQAIFSTLSKWFVFIDAIDEEILPYLKLTAKYTEKNHNSYFIVEELERLVQNSPKNVGTLYIEMLTNDIFPTYKQEQIENTIESMYKLGEKNSAKMICNLYRKRGIYFLNEISKQYEI
ncbi:hypothetical protein [Sulfurimonas xiamenensis]|uniref:Uncharacterized protein n=1 Tax=Sulfurimonas xiamenensis TaxID=2590021 RepID=A0AAJ4A3B9_9BACT|nr:hypothetical protein [Sulfurimonas xiamenensis]QFR43159.1 hypothetical protein FJR47_04270 [Sulfurimonas xiamenensis]